MFASVSVASSALEFYKCFMSARRASCAIVRRCALHGIELKVYTSYDRVRLSRVREKLTKARSYTCVMLECKGVLIYMDV